MPPKKPLPGRSALAGILNEVSAAPARPAAPSPAVAPASAPVAGDPLALVRRILGAREPAALVELEAGLVEAAKGEAVLTAWLARPVAITREVDTLTATRQLLATLTETLRTAPKGARNLATLSNAVATLSKTIEKIEERRPPKPTTNEVHEKIKERADDCVDLTLKHTRAAAAKFVKARAELATWSRENLAPRDVAELERRVSAMLGEDEKT